MQHRKTALICFAGVVAIVLCAIFLFVFQNQSQGADGNMPLAHLLEETDFEGSQDEWLNSLSDEQKAAIDIAFESSVASGYSGVKDEWLASELLAHFNSAGDIVIVLPDGTDFTVDVDSSSNGGAAPAQTAGSAGTLLIVDDVQCHSGDRGIAVPVRVEGNPGILGMTLSISYDESALTLKSAENGDAFRGILSMTHSQSLGTGCSFTWDGVEIMPGDIRDGAILMLYFDISSNARPGAYPVTVRSVSPVFNGNLDEIGVSTQDGNVVVN